MARWRLFFGAADAGGGSSEATISPAAGVSTAGTLTGAGLVVAGFFSPGPGPLGVMGAVAAAGSVISQAAGAATAGTLGGSSIAAAILSAAAGLSSAGTLTGSGGGTTLDAVLVGTHGATTSNTVTTGSGTSSVSGSTFLIGVSWDATTSISSVSDSKSNTYTAVGTPQNDGGAGSGGNHQFYVCENGTGGTSHTATVNFSGTAYPTAHLIEITGAATPVQDIAVQTQDAGTPFTASTGTLAQANEVIVALCGANIGSAGAYASSNFTILSQENDVSQYWGSAVASLVVSSTSSVTPSFTRTNSSGAAAVLAISFYEDAGGEAAISPAAGVSTCGTLTGSGGNESAISAAAGVSTTATLTGSAISQAHFATPPTIGVHTLLGIEDGSGSDPETTSPINTQASGSSLVTFTAGYTNNSGGPTDSEGNTWTSAGSEVYTGYGGQFDVRGYYVEVATGDTGHTVTFQADGTPAGEMTIPFVEIKNAGKLVQVAQNYPAAGSALTSGNVTTTGPAVLLAFWWGDTTGLTHTASPNNSFTNIEEFGNLPPNSAVQCFVAAREVTAPGTYNVTWTETPDQGAPLWLFAFQNANSGAFGVSTTGTLAGAALKTATFTGATGTSTAGTLAGASVTAAALTAADGVGTASTLAGSSTAACAPAQADGVTTASALAGASTAAAAITQADGATTASTLAGVTGSGSTITAADGVSTTGTLVGSSTAATTATAADGITTASALAGGSVAEAALASAAGTSTTSTLTGVSGSGSVIAQADGLSTTGTLVGASTAASGITQADGAATAAALAGSSTAAATLAAAAGTSTGETLAGISGSGSVITAADGVATTGTLVGSSSAAAAISQAGGVSSTGTIAGTSDAAAAISGAAGVTTASTITATGIRDAAITGASGVAAAATLAGGAVAAATATQADGAASAGALAGTSEAAATFGAAAGVTTAATMVGADGAIYTPGRITLSDTVVTGTSLDSVTVTSTTLGDTGTAGLTITDE